MQPSNRIAEAILTPAQSYTVTTTPGRKLHFLNGRAEIFTPSDLEYVLGLPNATVRPEPRYREDVAGRIAARDEMHPAKAGIDTGGLVLPAEQYADWIQHPPLETIEPTAFAGDPDPPTGGWYATEPGPPPPPEPEPEPVPAASPLAEAIARRRKGRGVE